MKKSKKVPALIVFAWIFAIAGTAAVVSSMNFILGGYGMIPFAAVVLTSFCYLIAVSMVIDHDQQARKDTYTALSPYQNR